MTMQSEKRVAVIHPDGAVRVTLRTLLQAHGCNVATLPSCHEFLEDFSLLRPDLILLDRSLLPPEGPTMLSALRRKWNEVQIVFLPEELGRTPEASRSLAQLLGIIDRFLQMPTTRELLAV
jgi:DNA-binding response OmpR family regulator